jgi:DNA-binding response OmpR family regulator
MSSENPTLLLVEDDPLIRTFLADNLTADGYELLVAGTTRDARPLLDARAPDLAVVDLALPDGDGLELVSHVRAADGSAAGADPDLPIVIVSGRAAELDRMRGWDRGADDYVVKPFSYPELRSRIAAVLRRAHGRRRTGKVVLGPLEIDPAAREVRLGGEVVAVAAKEFALLRALAADPTRVFTKEELLRDVWGFRALGHTRTLDSHACRLRQKLAARGGHYVANVWGVGYRLLDDPVAA